MSANYIQAKYYALRSEKVISDKGSGTSNRLRHLKSAHPFQMEQERPKESAILENFIKTSSVSSSCQNNCLA